MDALRGEENRSGVVQGLGLQQELPGRKEVIGNQAERSSILPR